jgi:hypothetical protein
VRTNEDTDACTRRRPDLHVDWGVVCLHIKVNENQHRTYDPGCERARLQELWTALSHRSLVVLRLNPDDYVAAPGAHGGLAPATGDTLRPQGTLARVFDRFRPVALDHAGARGAPGLQRRPTTDALNTADALNAGEEDDCEEENASQPGTDGERGRDDAPVATTKPGRLRPPIAKCVRGDSCLPRSVAGVGEL